VACPVQSKIFSCYLRSYFRGIETENRKFIPMECRLSPFIPRLFLELVRNRNLVFSTDSISMQFYEMIVCSLHGITENNYNIEWRDRSKLYGFNYCAPGGKHCHLSKSTVRYPYFNASLSLLLTHWGNNHGDHTLQHYINSYNMTNKDILILNFGLHFSNAEQYEKRI